MGNLLLFNKFVNGAVAIQCLSENELKLTRFRKNKFIGTSGINMPEKRKNSFNKDKIDFVYIGRLESYIKGLDLMIKAVNHKKKFLKENNCRFYIYGPDYKGRYANVEKLIVENGVEDLVFLSHEVSGSTKENILLSADIFIQTSRTEGLPLGILEAMSYGLPCLITEGTTLVESVKRYNAGWTCETNFISISETLCEAIENKSDYIKKSDNAIQCIEESFGWDEVSLDNFNKYKKYIK